MSSAGFTTDELLACFVAGEIEDGDRIFIGPQPPVPRAGSMLAHLAHGPDVRVAIGLVVTNLLAEARPLVPAWAADHRFWPLAESVVAHDGIFECPDACSDVFFTAGLQIDRYANTNLIGTLAPDGSLALRGPGSLGAPTMAHYARRYYVYAPVHDRRTFVERCDLISVFGHGDGGDHRARLGLDAHNGGPTAIVTPLAILDCATADHRLRLRSVHPGVTVADVVAATGFELEIPGEVAVTRAPTAAQLELLRTRIDLGGELRAGTAAAG